MGAAWEASCGDNSFWSRNLGRRRGGSGCYGRIESAGEGEGPNDRHESVGSYHAVPEMRLRREEGRRRWRRPPWDDVMCVCSL